MNILLYEWNSYLQNDVKETLSFLGISINSFFWHFEDKNYDEKFECWFQKNINIRTYDAVFSVNYWPLISTVCQKNNIRYIAWCYDNPLNVLDVEKTMNNSVNSIYMFDKIQVKKYLDMGMESVKHLPLGVNCSRIHRIKLEKKDYNQYKADVSFVGSLYESRYWDIYHLLDEYTQGYLQSLISAQQLIYGYYLFDELVNDEMMIKINQYIQQKNSDTSFILVKEALTFAMASEVSRKERILLLTLMGKYLDTNLYSFNKYEFSSNVKCHPVINYEKDMYKVFMCTKINLNPSLKCIQSGIPLRALDIMGAGGFLLSNYQPELSEWFDAGNDMVVYEDATDALEKALYYCKNDAERKKIAMNGKEKVELHFDMRDRMREMLKNIFNY